MSDRERILGSLKSAMPSLCQTYGVRSLALFGSVARGAESPQSDVDVLVCFEPDAAVTLITLAQLQRELESLLGRGVDLVEDYPGLAPRLRASIERDIVRVA